MSLWQHLRFNLGLKSSSASHSCEVDETLYSALEDMAQREQRPTSEMISEVIANGLDQRFSQEDLIKRWQSLSPREQEVAALASLCYTNRQIAARLLISAETVKTHLRNALIKFNLHSRSELSLLLSKWDFSAWERQ
jgi:DNA-binding NarL/FixJ family response regulator